MERGADGHIQAKEEAPAPSKMTLGDACSALLEEFKHLDLKKIDDKSITQAWVATIRSQVFALIKVLSPEMYKYRHDANYMNKCAKYFIDGGDTLSKVFRFYFF